MTSAGRTTVLLVRHAAAGVRGTWPGDDLGRELSQRGRREADAIRDTLTPMLDGRAVRVSSSRAVRCVTTVGPLATSLGVEVDHEPLLLEGADPTDTLAWLEGPDAPDVACSHGDVIGGVVTLLAERGLVSGRARRWPKAGTWVLSRPDGRITDARLLAPPTVG